MSKFFDRYKARCEELRRECDQQIADGELTETEANFRYEMVKDELLMDMPIEQE